MILIFVWVDTVDRGKRINTRHYSKLFTMETYRSHQLQIKECINRIHQNGIRLVCFDFDQTAYRGHTGGALTVSTSILSSTMTQMAAELTPDFLSIVDALCDVNIAVAIVTFGDSQGNKIRPLDDYTVVGGEALIRPLLNMRLGRPVADHVPIYALNPDWRNTVGQPSEYRNSKEWHLTSAMQHFNVEHSDSVLLIDDSAHNISEAAQSGFHTVSVSPDTGFTVAQLLDQFPPPSLTFV